ncbi:MAG: DNA polymerase III subunit beta [Clostridiaceae bacterium]|nr:DNA polymerase III subunit beta [Clostridiaceae bacterium]
MKVIVLKQTLLDAINIVQKAVMPKATTPILEGIYIEAGEKLTLIGNSFDLGIQYTVDADILEKGSVVINGRIIGDIIRSLPEAPVSIEVFDDSKVRIECINSYFEIRGIDGSNYPLIPESSNNIKITMAQATLKDLIRKTIFSVGNDENRKIMTGSLIQVDNGIMKMVALDGFRMAVCHAVIKDDAEFKVIIPGKNMNEILRILDSSEDPVTISLSGNTVSFDLKNCRIVSNVLDGEFMNYKSYIPTQFETVIEINTKDFIEGLERASLISTDEKRYPVRLQIGDDNLVVSSATDIGVSKDTLKIENKGSDMVIGFNPRYLIDALKTISDEKVKVSFSSSIGPCIITAVDHDRYLYLVLPVRLAK